jgi:hypothetical protein
LIDALRGYGRNLADRDAMKSMNRAARSVWGDLMSSGGNGTLLRWLAAMTKILFVDGCIGE